MSVSYSIRQQKIIQHIELNGYTSIEQLVELCNVTPQTIRRDLTFLDDHKALVRHHGGADVPSSSIENVAYKTRMTLHHDAKVAIAKKVAEHIPNHCSLIINIGTSTEEVAKALIYHKGLSVITNNLNVASILSHNSDCEVIIAGGIVRQRDQGVIGEATIDFISQFKVDYAVVGISSIELDGSLRDYDYREVKVAQTIINHAKKVFLVADHSKFNREALVELGHISKVNAVFTDKKPPRPLLDILKAHKVDCFLADVDK